MVVQVVSAETLAMSRDKSVRSKEKKYVIVKNHVRDLTIRDEKHSRAHTSVDRDLGAPKSKKFKRQNQVTKPDQSPPVYTQEVPSSSVNDTVISASDLEELRNVYNKCKAVIKKIETKYGHLLNLETEVAASDENKHSIDTDIKEDCHCSANTKIIFDENGQQIVTETVSDIHICPKQVKRKYSDLFKTTSEKSTVQVEYETPKQFQLPEDLQTLQNMLQDPNIEITQRNEMISKVRAIKQEHHNDIKFSRPSLKEKLKGEPNQVLEFKGANLFTLPGYPDWK